jgi:ubiquinone/menaquinone biosynthesis C-methylase UbiE
MTALDHWAQWLLHRRHGDDTAQMQAVLDFLYPVRDKVLANAQLKSGDTLLDVGCGDGLIGFGALAQVPDCRVIFSDISPDLLTHAEGVAREIGVRDRCRFIRASADDLKSLADSSLDAVTTRSVLIYVADKRRALAEFHRVLQPGGRLSIFEPINRFMIAHPPNIFMGYDLGAVQPLVDKVLAAYNGNTPLEKDSMLNFDERDLVALAEQIGFRNIQMELQLKIGLSQLKPDWNAVLKSSPNPNAPTLEEALRAALTPAETESFVAHLRPLVEAGQRHERSALMYLWAIK